MEENIKINAPILLIGFNRPEVIAQSFACIRDIQPAKLYVAIDGPRANKLNEDNAVNEVISIVTNVDWECETHYLIHNKNLGCKENITGAISWVLENEDRVIIIEDDIIPSKPFWTFVDEMLEKYKNEPKIAMVSGNNYTPIKMDDDYLFSKYGHIWGWATWKRSWDGFDVNIPDLNEALKNKLPRMTFQSKKERKYFVRYFNRWHKLIKEGKENAWGPQYSFYRFQNNLLSIVPKTNLASNIGNISSRSGSVSVKGLFYFTADESFLLKTHPYVITNNNEYDVFHFAHHIYKPNSLYIRLIRKVRSIIKLLLSI